LNKKLTKDNVLGQLVQAAARLVSEISHANTVAAALTVTEDRFPSIFQGLTISPVVIATIMTKSLRIIGRYVVEKAVKLGESKMPLNYQASASISLTNA
jgi:hypothetical protein